MNTYELDLLELGLRVTAHLTLEEKIHPHQGWIVSTAHLPPTQPPSTVPLKGSDHEY